MVVMLYEQRAGFRFVGAEQCAPIAPTKINRCSVIWEALKREGASDSWRRPDGLPIYTEHARNLDFEPALLDNLRERSGWFSGWWLSNFTSTSHPSWMDGIAAHYLPLKDGNVHWSIPAYRELSDGLPSNYVCRAPMVCGEMGFDVDGIIVNPDVAGYQERMRLLHVAGLLDRLTQMPNPVIVEIGTGYGALAYFIKQVVPHATYYLIDLPISLQFAGCYLTVAQDAHRVRLVDEEFGRGDFVLVPANRYEDSCRDDIDLALNTLSFNEMPPNVVDAYGRFISKRLAAGAALFEQNFSNDLGQAFFSETAKALAPHFKTSSRVPGDWRWGFPTIWRND
jgi:hypothetical protein